MTTPNWRVTFTLLAFFAFPLACLTCNSAEAAQSQNQRVPITRTANPHSTGSWASSRPRRPGNQAPTVASARTRQASFNAQHAQFVAPGVSGQSLEAIPFQEDVTFDPNVVEPFQAYADPSHAYATTGCDQCGMSDACCCEYTDCLFDWSRAEFWLGLTSFTGEGNFPTAGTNNNGQIAGSFGFQQGFNFGSRVPCLLWGQLGAQIGMRFTQTQLDGSSAGPDNRNQTFLTGGLFRRVDYGLQGGLVVDYLHNDWFYKADLLQLRGELSFLFSPCHDFGFRFTNSQQTQSTTATITGSAAPVPISIAALNTYRFFYRHRFGEGNRGQADWQVGWSENSGTILGIEMETPLHNQLGLKATGTYLIPSNDITNSFTREGWNIGIAIVWTPCRLFGTRRDYYRPLFEVADNGSLFSNIAP